MDKVLADASEAVAQIQDGASIAFGGFGVGHTYPVTLLTALRDSAVGNLTFICNSLGMPGDLREEIVARGKVRRLVISFTSRPGARSAVEDMIDNGQIEYELVPQGMLAERCRAAAAGIPAFYSPVGIGTKVAAGKELRTFGERTYSLETAITPDFAMIRAFRADRSGNVEFRGSNINFNVAFGKAARRTFVEVDEIVEVGEISPERVGLPGLYVAGIVKNPAKIDRDRILSMNLGRRPKDTCKTYLGKPALTRDQMAARAARLLPPGAYVNLGTGIPTLVSNHIRKDVTLHGENGILGYGALVTDIERLDPDVYNASGEFVELNPGAAYCDSVGSFEIARGGRLHAVMLGAYQVDERGDIANFATSEQTGGGIGGAMDLIAGDCELIVLMEHQDSKGRAKLLRACTFPITAPTRVDVLVTDLALLRRGPDGFVLAEIAPGFTVDEVLGLTEMRVTVADRVRDMLGAGLDD